MASAWLVTRTTSKGEKRYRVYCRLGGREASVRYAGSFRTRREALERKQWVTGELAARRVPDVTASALAMSAPTLTQACERWKASRVDVTESTRVLHRVALDRVLPILGFRTIDSLTGDDVAHLIEQLDTAGKKRETIRKSVKYLAAVLDFAGVEPNPARDKQRVRLPYEEPAEMNPPTAEHVEAVYRLLAPAYRLPLLWLDWSGARLGSVDSLRVSDYDERDRRIRLRASTTKTRAPLWVEHRTRSPTLSRRPWGRVRTVTSTRACFPGSRPRNYEWQSGGPAKPPACRCSHDLRHRRISLLHRQGRSWAEIARFVGQRKLSVTADTYSHVMSDGQEVEYAALV